MPSAIDKEQDRNQKEELKKSFKSCMKKDTARDHRGNREDYDYYFTGKREGDQDCSTAFTSFW